MPENEIKLVIEKHKGFGAIIGISKDVASQLSVHTGDFVTVLSPTQGIKSDVAVKVEENIYPFIVEVDPSLLNSLKIKSVDLKLSRAAYKAPIVPKAMDSAPPAAPITPAQKLASTEAPQEHWVLIPNQVDSYQSIIVDEQGNPVYGLDASGFPLDSARHPYTHAYYYDPNASRPANTPGVTETPAVTSPSSQSAGRPRDQVQSSQKIQTSQVSAATPTTVQMLDSNQTDTFGVQITDSNGNPIFGMDASGNNVLDSAGNSYKMTRWVEVELVQELSRVKFNAVLIIDISRSMMARDLEVKDADAAIRTIKVSMKSPVIQDFLNQFKDGILVPRRMGAALAAITFLAEKIARGHGEKVAVIRFADTAESLDFDGAAFMDGAGGAQDILEKTAISIVEKIGNSYGQATEIGKALYLTLELARLMQDMEAASDIAKPVMCVLLTDGYPTDNEAFASAIEAIKKNYNIVLYIIGLGSPNAELMTRAAAACGGEFFMPADVGQLLSWYMKKASEFKPRTRMAETDLAEM